jgi:Ras-specific guanine nucleotide-releasing factor 1
LAIGTSSPSRRRKLSLNIPIITGGKALELASLGCSSDSYANIHSPISPFGKTTLDTGKLCMASSLPKTPEEIDVPATIPEKPGELSASRKHSKWIHEQNYLTGTHHCLA